MLPAETGSSFVCWGFCRPVELAKLFSQLSVLFSLRTHVPRCEGYCALWHMGWRWHFQHTDVLGSNILGQLIPVSNNDRFANIASCYNSHLMLEIAMWLNNTLISKSIINRMSFHCQGFMVWRDSSGKLVVVQDSSSTLAWRYCFSTGVEHGRLSSTVASKFLSLSVFGDMEDEAQR